MLSISPRSCSSAICRIIRGAIAGVKPSKRDNSKRDSNLTAGRQEPYNERSGRRRLILCIGSTAVSDHRTSGGGDLDSTEIWFCRMRAEDHHPRKSDGNQHNCEHAARSRSVKTCERPVRSACGPELDVISAGWRLTAISDVSGETISRLAPGGFSASSRQARHHRGGYAS